MLGHPPTKAMGACWSGPVDDMWALLAWHLPAGIHRTRYCKNSMVAQLTSGLIITFMYKGGYRCDWIVLLAAPLGWDLPPTIKPRYDMTWVDNANMCAWVMEISKELLVRQPVMQQQTHTPWYMPPLATPLLHECT